MWVRKAARTPRPVCPECGAVVDPKHAAVLPVQLGQPRILPGTYCSADHLLDALARGWPWARMKHLGDV